VSEEHEQSGLGLNLPMNESGSDHRSPKEEHQDGGGNAKSVDHLAPSLPEQDVEMADKNMDEQLVIGN